MPIEISLILAILTRHPFLFRVWVLDFRHSAFVISQPLPRPDEHQAPEPSRMEGHFAQSALKGRREHHPLQPAGPSQALRERGVTGRGDGLLRLRPG